MFCAKEGHNFQSRTETVSQNVFEGPFEIHDVQLIENGPMAKQQRRSTIVAPHLTVPTTIYTYLSD